MKLVLSAMAFIFYTMLSSVCHAECEGLHGDVSADGAVTNLDALMVQVQFILGNVVFPADTNGDGRWPECTCPPADSPTSTPTETPTPQPSSTATLSPTATVTPPPTGTHTPSPTQIPTGTPDPFDLYADRVVDAFGVLFPERALGKPDGFYASFPYPGSWAVFDMGPGEEMVRNYHGDDVQVLVLQTGARYTVEVASAPQGPFVFLASVAGPVTLDIGRVMHRARYIRITAEGNADLFVDAIVLILGLSDAPAFRLYR